MNISEMGFTTKSIHAGSEGRQPFGALNVPVYQSVTFEFENCAQGGRRFAGDEEGYIYARLGNPTTYVLEKRIAALEGAEDACAFSSGIGAISSTIWTLCKAGDHIIADTVLYGCTFSFLEHGITSYGVEVTFVDTSDVESLKKALKPNTAIVYLETPANPNLKILDIAAISSAAHYYNSKIKVICDNTFATPYLQQPLSLGCDIVVHSATKYLNGHGDVIAGVTVGSSNFIAKLKAVGLKDMTGAVLGSHDAYMILRGLKTLPLRMDRHCENAAYLAEYFENNPKVDKVLFPGNTNHPNHNIAQKQMSQFGGMVAIEVKGGREAGSRLVDHLRLCVLAVSLGDAETLVEHPASMTHATYSACELKAYGIPSGLIRISAGLEDIEDIIYDFEEAFKYV